ncbi:MAG: peptidoglycan-binding domain-containing protein [Bryobacteraceae bacterium]
MVLRLLAAGGLLLFAWGVVAQTSKTAPKQPAPVKKSAPVKKAAAAKKTATAKKATPKSKKRVVARRQTQQKPSPERYSEIQNALIARGYLQGPASGDWSAESVAALKRFQEEQKLEATGKIDALSLIRLGLGPKRELSAQAGGVSPSEPR